MDTQPKAEIVVLECMIENAELAPDYAAALCPEFLIAVAANWPEKSVTTTNTINNLGNNSDAMVIQLSATIKSSTVVHANIQWNSADSWKDNGPNIGETLAYAVSDATLGAGMTANIIKDLLALNDPFADE